MPGASFNYYLELFKVLVKTKAFICLSYLGKQLLINTQKEFEELNETMVLKILFGEPNEVPQGVHRPFKGSH